MAFKRLAIIGPALLVIDFHLALLPIDVHLPIGPKQGAFTIHMTHSLPGTSESSSEKHQFRAKFGKIGTFQYVPAQIMWREIHPSICSEDQLVQTPLATILQQQLGAVSFSLRWCQVDASQHKCLCFDIDIKHEPYLPLSVSCESFQLTVQHQCPIADTFRAEIPLVECETRRDHWNKVIAQQMIPKEGRVSHVSFEQDKKQAARRYYDLRSTTIDSCNDCTNVITFSSQSPSWFFSPKKLNISLKECLQEINQCDNSFTRESFTDGSSLVGLNLNHHEFPKYRDHGKWIFCHLLLGPGQCFKLKSVHFEHDQWKVRYYDELLIRTFEQASIFITLPPGASISQVLDNIDWCQLQECHAVENPSPHCPPSNQSHSGLRGQYSNTTPSKEFVNGQGLSYASQNGASLQAGRSVHKNGPIYCPPVKHARPRSKKTKGNDSDVDMTPVQCNHAQSNDNEETPHPQHTHVKCKDTTMECCPTALDPEEDSASRMKLTASCPLEDQSVAERDNTEVTFDQCTFLPDADTVNVGDPRLAHLHPSKSLDPVQNNTRVHSHDDTKSHAAQLTKEHEAGLGLNPTYIYRSIYRSIYLYVCLSINFSIHLSIELTIFLSICLSVYLSIKFSLSLYIYIYLSLSLSICLSVYLSVYVSTHLFLYLSWYLTICLCVYVSICLSRLLFL